MEGFNVGNRLGDIVGMLLGGILGSVDGSNVGLRVGDIVDGASEAMLGSVEGARVGTKEGERLNVGLMVGSKLMKIDPSTSAAPNPNGCTIRSGDINAMSFPSSKFMIPAVTRLLSCTLIVSAACCIAVMSSTELNNKFVVNVTPAELSVNVMLVKWTLVIESTRRTLK